MQELVIVTLMLIQDIVEMTIVTANGSLLLGEPMIVV